MSLNKNKKTLTGHAKKGLWFALSLFVLTVVLIAWDIHGDLVEGTTFSHILTESIMMLAATVGALYFWHWLQVSRQMTRDQKRTLEKAQAEMARWQEEERGLLQNLREVIDKQFTEWGFSSTDREIAYFLLNGLSLKEIAELRGSTDKSIKQQAYMLYRKAGLGGRTELSAYFLGELIHKDTSPHDKSADLESRAN